MTSDSKNNVIQKPLLEVKNLEAGYGSKVVLGSVSFEVLPGEIISLLGVNGSGKSTCFKTLVGLIRPISGTIEMDGVHITGRKPAQNAKDGLILVPEGARSFTDLSVRENLDLCRFVVSDMNTFRLRLEEVMATFPRLGQRVDERAGTLSGGERQMLAIGRALILRPKVLLLDEPFLGLAPIMIAEVIKQLKDLKKNINCGIVLAEQNVAATLRVTDRVLLVRDGCVTPVAHNLDNETVYGMLIKA